jgi:hypothetical protein
MEVTAPSFGVTVLALPSTPILYEYTSTVVRFSQETQNLEDDIGTRLGPATPPLATMALDRIRDLCVTVLGQ